MDAPPFTAAEEGGIAHVRLNRPQAANALNMAFWEQFPLTIRGFAACGRVRAIVVSGEGKNFCAGMDLSVLTDPAFQPGEASGDRERFFHTLRRLQGCLSTLAECRVPVIAAIQGACIGGGLDLASACDLRFASPDAYFRIEEINIGMMADVGSLQRLPRLLPDAVLRDMAFRGSTLQAVRAESLGFVNAVDADPLAAAMHAARAIAARAPLAVTGSKRAINHAREHSVAESLEHVAMLQAFIWHTPDILAAMQARAEKREGDFAPLQPL